MRKGSLGTTSIYPSHPNPGRREKNKLNFYFHTSLRCLKRFYEGFKDLLKPFEAPQRRVKINNLTWFLFQYNFQKCTEREGLNCFMGSLLGMLCHFISKRLKRQLNQGLDRHSATIGQCSYHLEYPLFIFH